MPPPWSPLPPLPPAYCPAPRPPAPARSLTYTAPAMVADPSLAIGMSEIGTMTSIFPIAYGFRCARGCVRGGGGGGQTGTPTQLLFAVWMAAPPSPHPLTHPQPRPPLPHTSWHTPTHPPNPLLLLLCARSKFVSGVLGSRTSPTLLLAGGLMATAALNIAFGFSTSLVWFCTWWAMNGMLQVRCRRRRRSRCCSRATPALRGAGRAMQGPEMIWRRVEGCGWVTDVPACAARALPLPLPPQGVGAPCCARILTSWFAAKERGTYWGESGARE